MQPQQTRPKAESETGARVRLGILGLGMAGDVMAPVAASHPRVCLAAAADLSAELRERFARDHRVEVHASAESLLRSSNIDAVYVATPHQFHAEHVLLAARHCKHVIVEKPMALTLAECDRMIAAARDAGTVLVVGHTHGFDPAVSLLRQFTLSGELGQLAMLALWNYTDFLYRPRRPEELDTALGGGIVFNQLPHQVDIARTVAACDVHSVRASLWRLDPGRPTEGCASAFLQFASGAAANIVYSGYDHFQSDEMHDWVGAYGKVRSPSHGNARRLLRELGQGGAESLLRMERYGYGSGRSAGVPTHPPHFGLGIATYSRGDVRVAPHGLTVYGDEDVREIRIDPTRTGRASVLDEFCAAVLDGRRAVHDGAFARGTLETCLAMLDSSRRQQDVVVLPAALTP